MNNSVTRTDFLKQEGLTIAHELALKNVDLYNSVLSVANLNREIWLVRDDSFLPIGKLPYRFIDNAVVDELSLDDPYKAFKDFKQAGVRVKTVGWKD
ncbi:hypothetical protein [Gimesia maris]|uniref:hypothetical protein n=1 Tax=Gimesia maris TaxID=122 RepID=UPI00241D9069|nr:hypothetical protein [Gimesia maris]|tara:strand:- start:1539 stop:1829 length:291 start_codon:yes stop_codon:yes gene_type:complete